MNTKRILMVITVTLCAMAAQAQTASAKWTPTVPEVGVCLIVTGNATSGNGVAVGVPFTVQGEVNASGVTDSRGQFRVRVKPVSDVSHLQFRTRIGNGPLSPEYTIDVAQGWWGDESTVSGGFSASYSIADLGGSGGDLWGWPRVSWESFTSGSARSSAENKTIKGTISSPATGGSARCVVSARSGMGGAADCAASITGGASVTEIKKFVFHPTSAHKHVPSMSVIYRQGNITVNAFASVNGGGLSGDASAAATAASSFVPAAALTASQSNAAPTPLNITKYLPPITMSGAPLVITLSQASTGQSKFHIGGGETAMSLESSAGGESGDTVIRTPFSAE